MRWYRLTASGLLVLGVAGCAAEHAAVAAGPAADPAANARMQKPEIVAASTALPRSLLDAQPERLADPATGRVAASIRATVNNVAILDEEVRDASYPFLMETQGLPPEQRTAAQVEIFNRELQRLVEREVILQDAYARFKGPGAKYLDKLKEAANKEFDRQVKTMKSKANLKTDTELRNYLRAQGLALEGMRRQYERNFMAMQYMRGRIELSYEHRVTPDEVREYYDKHPEEFQVQDSVQWQDVFIDAGKYPNRQAARQLAERVVQLAKEGQDFAKLSLQYDNGDSSYRNGEGYGRRRGEVRPPEAEAVLFQLKDGQVGPVVEQANGFHVVRLVKREYAGRMPFDEKVQLRVRDKLKEEVANREYKRILAEMKRNATIEYARTAP
jgi:parvulin-like peptidyl-prolyl isomerase